MRGQEPRNAAIASLLLGLAVLLGACDGPRTESRTEVLALASREPDQWVRSTGNLVASTTDGLGRHDLGGFEPRATPGQGGEPPIVWARSRRAVVGFEQAKGAALAQLALVLRSPRSIDQPPIEVVVQLGGVELGRVLVGGALERFEFAVPKGAVRTGPNALVLECATFDYIDHDDDSWGSKMRGFGLASVELGGELRARRVPRGLELAGGTACRYLVEEGPAGALHLAGRAEQAGVLVVRAFALDPLDGSLAEHARPHFVAIDAGRDFKERVDLEPIANGPCLLELAWHVDGPTQGAVVLRRADVERAQRNAVPPILFISIDTLSARNLSLYGYDRKTSPHLERLARDAVTFDLCRANSAWTVPSYLSQFTGLQPEASWSSSADTSRSKIVGWEDRQLAPGRYALAEMLRARGYATFAAIDNPWLNKIPGFAQGFDVYDIAASERGIGDREGGLELVLAKARVRLDGGAGGAPPFLFLQGLDVHGPYLPAPPFRGRFGSFEAFRAGGDEVPLVDPIETVFGAVERGMLGLFQPDLGSADRVASAAVRAAYDETVAEVDARLGAFFDWLQRRGLYDDALIIVTSDHGEQMEGNDFLFDHGMPYEQTNLVPLVIKLPRSLYGGTRVADAVELVDLYATLAEVVGIDATSRPLDGRSLLPLMAGATRSKRPTFVLDGSVGSRAVVDGEWKLVVHRFEGDPIETLLSYRGVFAEWAAADPDAARELLPDLGSGAVPERLLRADLYGELERAAYERVADSLGAFERGRERVELYRWASDPMEARDVAGQYPDVVERLSGLLRAEFERGAALRAAVEFAATPQLGAAEARELEALGYRLGRR